VQNVFADPKKFPKMAWATNYFKLAAATMFTLFFGGKIFAPQLMVNHPNDPKAAPVNIQEFLQSHYMNAVGKLVERVVEVGLHDSVVVGYDTLNEPSRGWIGATDIGRHPEWEELRHGFATTPFQSMMLGEGLPTKIDHYTFSMFGPIRTGKQIFNPEGERSWKQGRRCVWAEHGVWCPETKKLLVRDYFCNNPRTGNKIDFLRDFWKPFATRFSHQIRDLQPRAIMFLEPEVHEKPPVWDSDVQDRVVYAPHFYDGVTLISKSYRWWNIDYVGYKRGKYLCLMTALKLGDKTIRNSFVSQLKTIKQEGLEYIGKVVCVISFTRNSSSYIPSGEAPCLIGEIGIPFDMDNNHAYRTGDYATQIRAMDANMAALEHNLLNYTIWNYSSDNNHEWGDQWNGEDLSLYSTSTSGKDPSQTLPSSQTKLTESTDEELNLDDLLIECKCTLPF
jgi:hypothetical protein